MGDRGQTTCLAKRVWEFPLSRSEQQDRLQISLLKEADLAERQLQRSQVIGQRQRIELKEAQQRAREAEAMAKSLERQVEVEREERDALVAIMGAKRATLELENQSLRASLAQQEACAVQVTMEERYCRLASSARHLAEKSADLRVLRARLAASEPEETERPLLFCDLIEQLSCCDDEDRTAVCEHFALRLPRLMGSEAEALAQTLLEEMSPSQPFPSAGRYRPLVTLLQQFCGSPQCIQALSSDTLKRLLVEPQQRLLQCAHRPRATLSSDEREPPELEQPESADEWEQLVQEGDSSCELLLDSIGPYLASRLLVELGLSRCEAKQVEDSSVTADESSLPSVDAFHL